MTDRYSGSVPARRAEAGFSLVEALIAAALLLFILIGVLPLFERSRLNLMQGNDATNTANAAVDATERLISLPFNNQATNIPVGTGTQLVATDFWLLDGNRWVPDMTPYTTDRAQYTRTTTIEQFQVTDLTDNGVLDTPLDGNTLPGAVQLKRIETDLVNARTAGGGAGTTYHIVTLRAK